MSPAVRDAASLVAALVAVGFVVLAIWGPHPGRCLLSALVLGFVATDLSQGGQR